jgi:hypothetical protein
MSFFKEHLDGEYFVAVVPLKKRSFVGRICPYDHDVTRVASYVMFDDNSVGPDMEYHYFCEECFNERCQPCMISSEETPKLWNGLEYYRLTVIDID